MGWGQGLGTEAGSLHVQWVCVGVGGSGEATLRRWYLKEEQVMQISGAAPLPSSQYDDVLIASAACNYVSFIRRPLRALPRRGGRGMRPGARVEADQG